MHFPVLKRNNKGKLWQILKVGVMYPEKPVWALEYIPTVDPEQVYYLAVVWSVLGYLAYTQQKLAPESLKWK